MTSKTPRTGNQYSIHHGDYSAVICELGAKIRRFDFNGKEIFCPFGVNDLTPTCNGYVLAPWPNRIENGEYDFNGKHYCAPVNEYHPAPRNNANHGYAYHYMWKLESLTDSAVTLSLRFPNLDGYPFDVTVTVTYELGENGMTVTINARNDGDDPAPLGSWPAPVACQRRAGRDFRRTRCRLRRLPSADQGRQSCDGERGADSHRH
jgi:aldose 1-epimerase